MKSKIFGLFLLFVCVSCAPTVELSPDESVQLATNFIGQRLVGALCGDQ